MRALTWVFSELLWFGLVVSLWLSERARQARQWAGQHDEELFDLRWAVVKVVIVLSAVGFVASLGAAAWAVYVERMW